MEFDIAKLIQEIFMNASQCNNKYIISRCGHIKMKFYNQNYSVNSRFKLLLLNSVRELLI